MASLIWALFLASVTLQAAASSLPIRPWGAEKGTGRLAFEEGHSALELTSDKSGSAASDHKTDKDKAKDAVDQTKDKKKEDKIEGPSGKTVVNDKQLELTKAGPQPQVDQTKLLGSESSRKCANVRCSPPPKEIDCTEKVLPKTIMGMTLTSDCCPAHICRRPDGSTYFHYGFEADEVTPTSKFTTYSTFSSSQSPGIVSQQNGPLMPGIFQPQPPVVFQPFVPPAFFPFNFGRQTVFGTRNPSVPSPAFGFGSFPGPFGFSNFLQQQNNRFAIPAQTSYATMTVADSSAPGVDRHPRNVFPGPFPFTGQGPEIPFAPAGDGVLRERRHAEVGGSDVFFRPGGFQPNFQPAQF